MSVAPIVDIIAGAAWSVAPIIDIIAGAAWSVARIVDCCWLLDLLLIL